MNTKKNTRNLHIEINHISVILLCVLISLGSKDRIRTPYRQSYKHQTFYWFLDMVRFNNALGRTEQVKKVRV